MNTPNTDFVMVRTPRVKNKDGDINMEVKIVRNNGKFDFSDYSYLRMQSESIEEWVPTAEIDTYKKVYGLEQ